MTKMQIVAKTALTVIGIHAIVLLLRHMRHILYPSLPWWQHALVLVLPTSLIIIIARLLILKNDSIACRITGTGEKLTPNKAASFLVCSYRVALLFYGLLILSSSTRQFNVLMTTFNPVSIRRWINNTLYAGFDLIEFCGNVINILPRVFIVFLTVYLIVGAPHFVRSQANRILCRTYQPIIEEN